MRAVRQIEEAFWTPILIDLAIRGGSLSLHRVGQNRSEELQDLQKSVFSFFQFTLGQLNAKRSPSDNQTILYNDHQWAIKQLKENGCITGEPLVRYEITEAGLVRLRQEIHQILSEKVSLENLERLMKLRDGDGPEWFIWLLNGMPGELLAQAAINANTRREFFLECVRIMPTDELHSFLIVRWEELRDLIGESLRAKHRYAISQIG